MSRSWDMTSSKSADVVVVGGGTVGAWTAVQLAERGAGHVVLLEAHTLGDGASSRAAGMVRAQGGTETAIRLGLRSQTFYAASGERYPLDCGFVAQGYLMPCFTEAEVAPGPRPDRAAARAGPRRRVAVQLRHRRPRHRDGSGVTLGGSYAPGDGYIDAPRNVLAYTAALTAHRVDVRERCAFTGLRVTGGRVVGVDTSAGPIDTEHVVLTGGPDLGQVGALAGGRIPAGGTRHQVVVTEPLRHGVIEDLPMVFDVTYGIYWRPGEFGGVLWGMSNPDEEPGVATEFDWAYYREGEGPHRVPVPAGARPRPAPHLGGDHRLHARPPADPRAACSPTTDPSRARSWPARQATA